MSWDIVLFNLNRKVETVEEINEDMFVETGTQADFIRLVSDLFPNLHCSDDHWCKIEEATFSIEFSANDPNTPFSNTILHLYGEDAIYGVIELCKKNGWQAFDTGMGTMLNLDKPAENGYLQFQAYLDQVRRG